MAVVLDVERIGLRPFFIAGYAAVVLLGAIDGAIWKLEVDNARELASALIATSVAVMAAHLYAELLAAWVATGHAPGRPDWREGLIELVAFAAVTSAACLALTLTAATRPDFDVVVWWTQVTLWAVLVILGVVGARAARASWPRALAAGAVAALVGGAVASLKYALGAA